MKRYSLFIAFIFAVSTLFAEDSMLGIFKSKQKSIAPIGEVYTQIIEQIDIDSCSCLSDKVLVYNGGDIDRKTKKTMKAQFKRCKHRKFCFTKRQTSDKCTHIQTSFYMVINPEKKGEELGILNVTTAIRLKQNQECEHLFSFTKEGDKWKINSKREIRTAHQNAVH